VACTSTEARAAMKRTSRTIVMGANGQLGSRITQTLRTDGVSEVIPYTRQDLDITDGGSVDLALSKANPDWVVNCAGHSNVEYCEAHPDEAFALQADAIKYLALACDRTGSRLVHISTDFVFDGRVSRPYKEDDATAPTTAYGRSKVAGEQFVRDCEGHLLVRIAWLFGGRDSFVARILTRASRCSRLQVVDDQTGSPSYAADVAEWIHRLMLVGATGTFHVANSGRASWHELASRAVEYAGLQTTVERISSRELGSHIRRPAYSVLDCTKYRHRTGHSPRCWSSALRAHIDSLEWQEATPAQPKEP
jgi:dTDP-4-dehydrorhamnose reductase